MLPGRQQSRQLGGPFCALLPCTSAESRSIPTHDPLHTKWSTLPIYRYLHNCLYSHTGLATLGQNAVRPLVVWQHLDQGGGLKTHTCLLYFAPTIYPPPPLFFWLKTTQLLYAKMGIESYSKVLRVIPRYWELFQGRAKREHKASNKMVYVLEVHLLKIKLGISMFPDCPVCDEDCSYMRLDST